MRTSFFASCQKVGVEQMTDRPTRPSVCLSVSPSLSKSHARGRQLAGSSRRGIGGMDIPSSSPTPQLTRVSTYLTNDYAKLAVNFNHYTIASNIPTSKILMLTTSTFLSSILHYCEPDPWISPPPSSLTPYPRRNSNFRSLRSCWQRSRRADTSIERERNG